MTTNRLAKREAGNEHFVSAYRASEYAAWARDKGLKDHAKAWEEAERDGWDDRHFSLARREELERKWGKPSTIARTMRVSG
jgi:hypothetical protein